MHHARSGSSARLSAALEPSLDWCEFHDTTLSVSAKPTSDPLLQGGVAGAGHGSWLDAVGLLGSVAASAVVGDASGWLGCAATGEVFFSDGV